MWRSRMFWQLFGSLGVLWLVSFGLLGMLIMNRVEEASRRQLEERLHSKAILLKEMVRGQQARQAKLLQERLEGLPDAMGTRITLLTENGSVLVDTAKDPFEHTLENHLHRPEIQQARVHGSGWDQRHSATLDRDMVYLALRTDDDWGAVGYVRVALDLDLVRQHVAGVRQLVWTAVASAGLIALAVTWWLARRWTRPLHELMEGAGHIAAGNFGQKVYAGGKDEIGQLSQAFNIMSERLASQFNQLAVERHQLRAILGGMIEGVVAIDAEQRILFANDRAAELFRFHPEQSAGRKIWEVIRQRGIHDLIQQCLSQSTSHSQDLNLAGFDDRHLTVRVAPLARPGGAILVFQDTTELRRLERLRQDFVANVSHELKTPLSVIKLATETLQDGAVEDAENRDLFLQQISEQADRLHALILDLLSLARIESGQEVFDWEAVALRGVVHDCLERQRARAEGKGQALELVPPATDDAVAWADDEAINQILDNLLDNAIKYTPEGGRIRIRWWTDNGQACFEVQDTGIGIPERDLPRIFERFYRVDKARSRELGGTGLGLSIVKHLVQAMQGTVSAASKLNEGTTFTVRLPKADAAVAAPAS